MVLVDGLNFTVNNTASPPTALCNTGSNDNSYAYDNVSMNTSGTVVRYYINGSLVYTSTLSITDDLYAKSHSYTELFKDAMAPSDGVYTFTAKVSGSTWSSQGSTVIGLEDTTTGSGRLTMQYCFVFSDFGGTIKWLIKEEGVEKTSFTAITVTDGDTFKIEWTTTPSGGSGTFFPPPPAYVRI